MRATCSGKLLISFAPVNYIVGFERRKLQNKKFHRGHATDVPENVRYGVSLSTQNECTSRPAPEIAHLATVFEHLRRLQAPTGLPDATTKLRSIFGPLWGRVWGLSGHPGANFMLKLCGITWGVTNRALQIFPEFSLIDL